MAVASSAQTIPFMCLLPLFHLPLLVSASASPSPFHFRHFALFGHIHAYDEANCRLRICVELGDHVWLQAIEDKYYIVQLPINNYSGLVGEASMLPCHEGDEAIWREAFFVHGDIGAYRLDIFLGDRNDNVGKQRVYVDGDDRKVYFDQHGIRQSHEMSPNLNPTQHLYSTATFARLQDESGCGIYLQKMISYFHCIKNWQIALVIAIFAITQLVKIIWHEGNMASSLGSEVDLLENELPWVDDNDNIKDSTNASFASRQLCMAGPSSLVKQLDMQNRSETPHFHGENTFEEAWHVAEECLNEEIVSNSQGTYLLYNCVVTEHEKRLTESSSALSKWNRDNAGRLIRQLPNGFPCFT